MQFLTKSDTSDILHQEIVYKLNGDNGNLRNMLIAEQKNYCAYTEKYLQPLEQVDVEHLDASKKGTAQDDYYNYYAVITTANKYKKDKKYAGASFFVNKFFQDKEQLTQRIGFANNLFYEIEETDIEARDFIDFLGLNHPKLSQERSGHLTRMSGYFKDAGFDLEKIKVHFQRYPSDLSFITSINAAFNFDFTELQN